MSTLTADNLAALVNAYTISEGPTKSVVVPQASVLAALQDVTVSGFLLPKQTIHLDPGTGERTVRQGPHKGAYRSQEKDGDLHFCLGINPGDLHIACELQNAAPWIQMFNQAIGQDITVSGYFRCLFEHPGFSRTDDAHIFEIHPVRAVTLNGSIQTFDVDIPDQSAIHTWVSPHDLNQQDNRIKVAYDNVNDILTFTDMDGKDENYVSVGGDISNVQLNGDTAAPASFTLTSPDITKPIQVYCLKGTSAALQLGQMQASGTTSISLIGLRNIDLMQALHGQYMINLVAINIEAALQL